MNEYILLSARPYDFMNDRQERIQGLKLSYVNPDIQQEGVMGFEPMIASVPAEYEQKLEQLPGRYRIGFEVVPGLKNRPVVRLSALEFVEALDFQGKSNV
jgi:hypothetical protein